MALISVIVPVYNVETYLRLCIDSILSQTFTDFELILIDDGSTDSSPSICDDYEKTDPRIKVFHQENGGVSSARNLGIQHATGKYVVFCDSDDYLGCSYLSDMISAHMRFSDKETLVLSNFLCFKNSTYPPTPNTLTDEAIINLNEATASDYKNIVLNFKIWGPYCKLYSRDIINENNISFLVGLKSAEDFYFNIQYLSYIKYVHLIPSTEYYYRVAYKPLTCKYIDDSAITSAHIIAHGLYNIADRMGTLDDVFEDISKLVAEKHFFGRLAMVFSDISLKHPDRELQYQKLCDDDLYYHLCSSGRKCIDMSTPMRLLSYLNNYWLWFGYYWLWNKIHTFP